MYYKVKGTSMFPTYKEGEIIEVGLGVYNIQIGDVIVFCDNQERVIAHRLWFYNHNFFITKGDNHEYFDIAINSKYILGIVKNSYRSVESPFIFKRLNEIEKNNNNHVLITHIEKFSYNNNLPFEQPLKLKKKYILLYDDTTLELTEISKSHSFVSVNLLQG